MSYQAGGKGIAPRRSDVPSWVGLEEISRGADFVVFRTRRGTKSVPVDQVEKRERMKR